MEADVTSYTVDVGLLGANAVVLEADARADEFEQARCPRRLRGFSDSLGRGAVGSDDSV
jgi:hypothetical protein